MTRLWHRLWVGGLTDAERLAKGNPAGIDSVISLCAECVSLKRRDVNYIHIPIEDDRPISQSKFDGIIDSIIENIRWGTVLLHCGVGISRAPSLAAAYFHCVGYKSFDDALATIMEFRPIINPSKILTESIRRHL